MVNLGVAALFHLIAWITRTTSTTSSPGFGIGVYNSSQTPPDLPWDTYNYCNAPHVNAEHYSTPASPDGSELVYLNVIMRHHKRTPDNLYPNEYELNPSSGWNCSNFLQFNYGGGGAHVFHNFVTPPTHPFLSQIWNGTCDEGQLTEAGLQDAIRHGKDFWGVYHDKVGFLQMVDERDIYVRTSVADRTFQVASGFLFGMDPATVHKSWPVFTEPSVIDSLVPNYACPGADAIRDAYQSVPAWTDHLQHNAGLKARLDATLGTAGLAAWASWYDHFFDTFTSRTCHGHPLPCNATGACVSEADASRVHAIGDFEYNYIWNAAENATAYTQLTFGVMFGELARNFASFRSGTETRKLRLYVGHDGSLIRLAAGLGLGAASPLRWPALGSEIVMEVWKTPEQQYFVRVLHEGTPVQALRWSPLDDFIELLQAQVPDDIFERCTQSSS
ncbi:hypothetical protein HETIRDRAFT_323470 [Heterobasidion irregulare TC 32-1]|uniref:Phosphoglycerate mutase-like protein n=1 Tax=Heterobasidion irregulare (strain TC 32-1) TaxID=747525 RepID=W4JZN1_HETIT|nr:uncharacterized protein HETIRDRAFT_323470 [Heterobasidion irregulare TC 32-1]ETW79038.1 hypothetical protein HETIRDRAFT_323470 [Heterobasidion irregulare TC 32-1]